MIPVLKGGKEMSFGFCEFTYKINNNDPNLLKVEIPNIQNKSSNQNFQIKGL